MSTLELKQILIGKIQSTEDISLLKDAIRLFEIDFDNRDVYMLSDNEKEAINDAQQQIDNGEFFTDEEVNQLIDAWLKK